MDILLDKYRSTEYDKVYIFYARKIIKTRFIAKVCHKNLQSKSSQEEQVVCTVSLNCCRECFFFFCKKGQKYKNDPNLPSGSLEVIF